MPRTPFGHSSPHCGFSLVEVLVVLGIVGLLLSLAIPAVVQVRERSRAATCMNHLRQLALAAQSHAASNRGFPYTSTTWWESRGGFERRFEAISAHRHLMAYIDASVFQRIDFQDPLEPLWTSAPIGQFMRPANRELHDMRISVFACPSDNVPPGGTSYRANLGISSEVLPPSGTVEGTSQKGAFVNGRSVFPDEFRDGLSRTALFSERVVGGGATSGYSPFQDFFATGDCPRGTENLVRHCRETASANPRFAFSFAGHSWLLGGWLNTWYTHILPPNSLVPDCGFGPAATDGGSMVVTARSFHPGGVHVAMADASVQFISDHVDLRVWRAAGTRSGRESADLQ
jgi:prepilin-type N-terminal cleavage/methylation domain-containing protein